MKYIIQTKKGAHGVVEGATMVRVVEAGRQFCKDCGEGWPLCVTVWKEQNEKPTKGGKK